MNLATEGINGYEKGPVRFTNTQFLTLGPSQNPEIMIDELFCDVQVVIVPHWHNNHYFTILLNRGDGMVLDPFIQNYPHNIDTPSHNPYNILPIMLITSLGTSFQTHLRYLFIHKIHTTTPISLSCTCFAFSL